MVNVLAIKDYNIGICCFSTKRASLRRKSKDSSAWNQDNVPEWGDMSIIFWGNVEMKFVEPVWNQIRKLFWSCIGHYYHMKQ